MGKKENWQNLYRVVAFLVDLWTFDGYVICNVHDF